MGKIKTCSFCNKQTDRLWFSKPPTCISYTCRSKAQEQRKSKSDTNAPENKKNPLKRSKINPISKKKAEDLKEYRKLRDKFMAENKICQVCKSAPSQELHHIRPRAFYLCDVKVFLSVCAPCHRKIHDNDSWARENGYLKSKHT